jgi:hypothetical protein
MTKVELRKMIYIAKIEYVMYFVKQQPNLEQNVQKNLNELAHFLINETKCFSLTTKVRSNRANLTNKKLSI